MSQTHGGQMTNRSRFIKSAAPGIEALFYLSGI